MSISRPVTITADGATVVLDGQDAARVMNVNASVVELVGLSITRGRDSSVPGAFPALVKAIRNGTACPCACVLHA